MKFLLLLILSTVLMFFDCSYKDQKQTSNNIQNTSQSMTQDLFTYKNKIGEIEYTYSAKLIKKEVSNKEETNRLQINYTVKNTSDKNYLLYNRGHFGTDNSLIYVEPNKEGVIEISQRAFREPNDKSCPNRYVPITPNASWLEAGKTISNNISVKLPLKPKTPFDDCNPQTAMPEKTNKLKFCLGISEADKSKVKINNKGVVEGWQYVKEQQLLCSDTVELK